jgi:hypothetical protein
MSDMLRVYVLAHYGGVWADVSVLPLQPLDDFLPAALTLHFPPSTKNAVAEARGDELQSQSQRSFFAYAFPDPLLSHEVSLIPFFYNNKYDVES